MEQDEYMTDSERMITALKAYHASLFVLIAYVSRGMSDEDINSLKSLSIKMMEETLRNISINESREEFLRLNKDFLEFLEEVFEETVGISANEYMATRKKFNDGDFN
jgi:hypothetical protein